MTTAHRLAIWLPALLLAGPAAAHHPMGGEVPSTAWHGLASGLAHPVIGPDHLAFLLAAGLVAGLARWGALRPLSFVLGSLVGVVAAWLGAWLPAVEWLVAATLLMAGVLLIAGPVRSAGWAALLPVAGLLHGQAYAKAMIGAEATPVLAYLLGLALVQALIVLAVAALVRRTAELPRAMVARFAGCALLAVGLLGLFAQA
ncbi:HupE/UreJ family protein [Falsiroseomonas tokyonensis]|uniref:HupE/UreJ family protein n=1 Tax=Falsiroseomonas tokyonensis TaxID=430521 RepID=A0ABV7BVH0_9PROT|nr:HupE/UreJ family protein [Falsiroseomonas tokyonensis]MBU8539510.1 HupE/UreJ family protein [Falsiroseomonas tokyonensis]